MGDEGQGSAAESEHGAAFGTLSWEGNETKIPIISLPGRARLGVERKDSTWRGAGMDTGRFGCPGVGMGQGVLFAWALMERRDVTGALITAPGLS